MATPKVYVICDQNCKFESMTKEQILSAIIQAVEEGTIGDVDAGFITSVKTINGQTLRFFYGEQSAYDALSEEEKENLNAVITNDATISGINEAIEELKENARNAVNKAGDEMTGGLVVPSFAVKNDSLPCVWLQDENGEWIGVIRVNTNNGVNRVYFAQRGSDEEHSEAYYLPPRTEGITTSQLYDILTSKNPVTVAQGGTGATTAAGARENLGAVNKAGDEMTGQLVVPSFIVKNNSFPTVWLQNTNGKAIGSLRVNTNNGANRVYIAQRGSDETYTEDYYLPERTEGITSTKNYYILTSKNPVTIAQGGTGATTAAGARENLGAVNKAGDEMTGTLTAPFFIATNRVGIKSNSWSSYVFLNPKGVARADIMVNGGDDGDLSTSGKLIFDQYLMDAEGNRTDVVAADGKTYACQERFQLPTPTAEGFGGDDKTHQKWFSILTSKNPVTIAQGGTGATTAEKARENLGIFLTPKAATKIPDGYFYLKFLYITLGGLGSEIIDFGIIHIDAGYSLSKVVRVIQSIEGGEMYVREYLLEVEIDGTFKITKIVTTTKSTSTTFSATDVTSDCICYVARFGE